MKKIFVILFSLVFIFLFSQFVVNADNPSYFSIDAEFEEQQELEDVKITIYFTSHFFRRSYSKPDDIFFLTIESRPDVCENDSHLCKNVYKNVLEDEIYICENGCLIDKISSEKYLQTKTEILYNNRYFTHKLEYSLDKEFFKHDSGRIIINSATASSFNDDNELRLFEFENLLLNYEVIDGFVYITKFTYVYDNQKNIVNCK